MTTLTEAAPQAQQKSLIGPGRAGPESVNVGPIERVLVGIGGGLLAFNAVRRPSLPNLLLAVVGGGLLYRSARGYCPMYQALGINRAHSGFARPEDFFDHGIHVEASVTVHKPANELFRFWRNFENLPRFMRHLESVACMSEHTSHWTAKAPAGSNVEWNAQIINEEENRLIAWRSLEGADVDNAGSVRFIPLPDGRGTEVRVVLDYIPPAGSIGYAVAKLFGEEPQQQISEDLSRFKQIAEAGEIATTEGQPTGRCS